MGYSEWSDFSCQHFVHVFQEAETEMLMPPGLAMGDEGTVTIVPGKAQGLLMGGNLTILTTLVGTPYMPDLRGKILFVEEVNEEAYRIDRMLTHLKLAGVFDGLAGFVFGKCINCEPETPEKALSFWEVLDEVIKPLGVPAFYGSVIGHLADQFIIPIGIEAAIDASNGSITLLTPSVRG
jgi:muramoyltetrapeptide carboxypeptidase